MFLSYRYLLILTIALYYTIHLTLLAPLRSATPPQTCEVALQNLWGVLSITWSVWTDKHPPPPPTLDPPLFLFGNSVPPVCPNSLRPRTVCS